jgi:hypothetical protein
MQKPLKLIPLKWGCIFFVPLIFGQQDFFQKPEAGLAPMISSSMASSKIPLIAV